MNKVTLNLLLTKLNITKLSLTKLYFFNGNPNILRSPMSNPQPILEFDVTRDTSSLGPSIHVSGFKYLVMKLAPALTLYNIICLSNRTLTRAYP